MLYSCIFLPLCVPLRLFTPPPPPIYPPTPTPQPTPALSLFISLSVYLNCFFPESLAKPRRVHLLVAYAISSLSCLSSPFSFLFVLPTQSHLLLSLPLPLSVTHSFLSCSLSCDVSIWFASSPVFIFSRFTSLFSLSLHLSLSLSLSLSISLSLSLSLSISLSLSLFARMHLL